MVPPLTARPKPARSAQLDQQKALLAGADELRSKVWARAFLQKAAAPPKVPKQEAFDRAASAQFPDHPAFDIARAALRTSFPRRCVSASKRMSALEHADQFSALSPKNLTLATTSVLLESSLHLGLLARLLLDAARLGLLQFRCRLPAAFSTTSMCGKDLVPSR